MYGLTCEDEGCFAPFQDSGVPSQSIQRCAFEGSNALRALRERCPVQGKSWTEVASCDEQEHTAHFVTNSLCESHSFDAQIRGTQIVTLRRYFFPIIQKTTSSRSSTVPNLCIFHCH